MTAQQLKNSILQMAVQGKLVPQDPSDEPASALLERIKAEKQELIKAGKIKKDKKSSEIFRGASRNLPYAYCEQIGKEIRNISDEIPFEIPDSWEWCRLSDITIKEIKRGKSPVYADSGSVLVFAQKCNVKTGGINISLAKYLADSAISKYPQEEYMQDGDIIVNSTGTGTLGRIGMYSNEDNHDNMPLVPDSHVTIVRVCSDISQYIYYILKWYQPYLEESGEGSTKQKELKADRIKELFIPIPPLAEQHRIVAKIEELLPYIERYGKAEEHLTALNTTFPEALKKSILQEAVQGKLVPQNPDDEPASVLLERIKAEKQALIKAGKIKRDKHESVIVTRDKIPYEIIDGKERCIADEVPFELPEGWALIRLNDIGIYRKGPFGSSLTKSMFVPKGADTVKVYEQKNAIKKDHTLGDYYITRQYYEDKMQGFTVSAGDIIVSCAGTIGETYVMPDNIELGIINQALMRMTIFAPIDIDYFLMYFDYVLKNSARESSKGSAIKNIPPFEIFKQLLLPLPPLAEQKRIVAKIEEIMPYINTITK